MKNVYFKDFITGCQNSPDECADLSSDNEVDFAKEYNSSNFIQLLTCINERSDISFSGRHYDSQRVICLPGHRASHSPTVSCAKHNELAKEYAEVVSLMYDCGMKDPDIYCFMKNDCLK